MAELTFESMLAETQEAKIKSDLSNLAHAHVDLQDTRRDLIVQHVKDLEEIDALLAHIEKVGKDPNRTYDEVKGLWDKVHKHKFRR